MSISKETFTFLVKNGFEKNDSEIINAFVDTYNQHFKTTIYDLTACGEYGLQGFISEGQGLNITDILHICEDYKANKERNTYFFFANCGNPCRLVAHLDEFINVMYDNLSARECFASATKFYTIMDTTNGHSKKYVELINEVWEKGNKGMWKQILFAIAYRDKAEMQDKGIIVETLEDAYDNADLILMRVCDNEDLEMILHYFSYL